MDHDTHLLLTASQLGQLLRTSRKSRALTQSEVAARLGLSQNRVSHLELHPEELSIKQLMAWCSAVGLELRIGERDGKASRTAVEW